MSDSFSMANMAPQLPGLNRAEWERLEQAVRAWSLARGDLYVMTGTITEGFPATIGAGRVAVPSAFWKVVVDPRQGEAISFLMPQRALKRGDLRPWQVSVKQIEAAAALSLPLPSGVDRNDVPAAWKVNIAGLREQRRRACGG